MVVNMHHADHQRYSDGDKDLSLEKFIFQHLLTFARREAVLEKLTRFYVQLDNRTEKYKGNGQKLTLNRRFRNETGHEWEIFAEVTDVDSKSQIMVQAADVLAGCVAWVWNRQYENEKVDTARAAFASHIADRANLRLNPAAEKRGIQRRDFRNFGYPTLAFQESRNFAIWKLNLRIAEEREAKAERARVFGEYAPSTTFSDVGKDYQIGAVCFECSRSSADVLPGIRHRMLKERYRPTCSTCSEKGYLTFKKRRPRP